MVILADVYGVYIHYIYVYIYNIIYQGECKVDI